MRPQTGLEREREVIQAIHSTPSRREGGGGGGSRGSNEPPLQVNDGGLKPQAVHFSAFSK